VILAIATVARVGPLIHPAPPVPGGKDLQDGYREGGSGWWAEPDHADEEWTVTTAEYLASPQALRDLRAINAQYIENFVHNDVAAHDRLLHEDFIAIQGDGSRLDRAGYLGKWATGFDPETIPYWDVRDELITVVADVALVRSTNKYVIHRDGRDTTGMTVYTDTYIYGDAGWRCVQAQTTPIAAAHEPADDTIITIYLKGVRQ
jgi:hypothetical protein